MRYATIVQPGKSTFVRYKTPTDRVRIDFTAEDAVDIYLIEASHHENNELSKAQIRFLKTLELSGTFTVAFPKSWVFLVGNGSAKAVKVRFKIDGGEA